MSSANFKKWFCKKWFCKIDPSMQDKWQDYYKGIGGKVRVRNPEPEKK